MFSRSFLQKEPRNSKINAFFGLNVLFILRREPLKAQLKLYFTSAFDKYLKYQVLRKRFPLISGRLVDSKAKTRSAGCAAYMAPERINPPNPNKPDYDIRADVWSLGITLVELATGHFPYKDCKTEFEVLTKVIQDDPPCLPPDFSPEFRQFVHDCLLKNHKDRPKYKKLLQHPFIVKYRNMNVDVEAWYSKVANHSGDPNMVGDKPSQPTRKSSFEQRYEAQTFKPQPSPRAERPRRMQNLAGQYNSSLDDPKPSSQDSFSRLKFYTPNSAAESGKPELNYHRQPATTTSPRKEDLVFKYGDAGASSAFSRLQDLPSKSYEYGGGHRERQINLEGGGNRLNINGSLNRNNYTSPYGSGASAYQSVRPTYLNSRSHEDYSSALKSPQAKRYDYIGSQSEANSPRDFTHTPSHRKYSFETLDSHKDYHYTPKGTRKYDTYNPDSKGNRKMESPRRHEVPSHEQPWAERPDSARVQDRGREALPTGAGARKYPSLPVPDQTTARGRDSSRNFLPNLKFSSWTLSSPFSIRRFRTSSSTDRTSNFDASRRQQPTYRSLNERDKQFYSSSGRSDKL